MVAPAQRPPAAEQPRMSVPAALLDQVVAYLGERPFREVVLLIGRLQAEARPLATGAPPEEV